jgi:hypothetical protein
MTKTRATSGRTKDPGNENASANHYLAAVVAVELVAIQAPMKYTECPIHGQPIDDIAQERKTGTYSGEEESDAAAKPVHASDLSAEHCFSGQVLLSMLYHLAQRISLYPTSTAAPAMLALSKTIKRHVETIETNQQRHATPTTHSYNIHMFFTQGLTCSGQYACDVVQGHGNVKQMPSMPPDPSCAFPLGQHLFQTRPSSFNQSCISLGRQCNEDDASIVQLRIHLMRANDRENGRVRHCFFFRFFIFRRSRFNTMAFTNDEEDTTVTTTTTDYTNVTMDGEYGTTEQISYAEQETPYTVSNILTGLRQQQVASTGTDMAAFAGQSGGVDYLFIDEAKMRGERSWGEKLCYNTGIVYGAGLTVGGAWGLMEGMRAPLGGSHSMKLRLNAVLNACTRRGPLIGNSAGVLSASISFISLLMIEF